MNSKKFLALILYLVISTQIISSYGCSCETVVKYLTLDIYSTGQSCGSYCTYNPVIYFWNRWNSNNKEVLMPLIACEGGMYQTTCYPAQGSITFQCVSKCCSTETIACVVSSVTIVKPRISCDVTSMQLEIPCKTYRLGC